LRHVVTGGEHILALPGFDANTWQTRYRYRPVLPETFVQKDRFAGTACQAANWTYVDDTRGCIIS